MDVPTLLTAIASHSETVAGIKGAHYPAPNFLNESELPALVLYWGGDRAARCQRREPVAPGGHGAMAGGAGRGYAPRVRHR